MSAANRNDFQELARMRRREAKVLLDAGNDSGAYYLAGLAIECALKACICKQTKRHDFPDKKKAQKAWQHDLDALLGEADSSNLMADELNKDPQLSANWLTVKDWKNDSRYEVRSEVQAKALYSAITARKYGVMQWLRKHW